jgi:hypothetical protein
MGMRGSMFFLVIEGSGGGSESESVTYGSATLPITIYLFSDDETRARVHDMGMRGGGGVNTSQREWGVGELEFEALMRMLDNSVRNKITNVPVFLYGACY